MRSVRDIHRRDIPDGREGVATFFGEPLSLFGRQGGIRFDTLAERNLTEVCPIRRNDWSRGVSSGP